MSYCLTLKTSRSRITLNKNCPSNHPHPAHFEVKSPCSLSLHKNKGSFWGVENLCRPHGWSIYSRFLWIFCTSYHGNFMCLFSPCCFQNSPDELCIVDLYYTEIGWWKGFENDFGSGICHHVEVGLSWDGHFASRFLVKVFWRRSRPLIKCLH